MRRRQVYLGTQKPQPHRSPALSCRQSQKWVTSVGEASHQTCPYTLRAPESDAIYMVRVISPQSVLPGGSAASPLSQGSGEQNHKVSLRSNVPSKERVLPTLHTQGHLVFWSQGSLRTRWFLLQLGWLWRIKQEQRGAPCFPELGCTVFFSSSSVSRFTLIILTFFAPLHIPQPKPHNRRSKPERWCWERATHKHTLMSQHRLWVPNRWWVWAIQIKNVNM